MTRTTDMLDGRVAVVGSGLAGLMTALCLAPLPVVLLTRGRLGTEGSSNWAQGGIAAAIARGDSAELHLADTLAAGDGLCDTAVAVRLLATAPAVIERLCAFGVEFDRTDDGAFAFGLEAAHSRHRILHAGGDATGAVILTALTEAVRRTPSIAVLESAEAVRLLAGQNRVQGLVYRQGQKQAMLSPHCVVLATGGLGGLYDASTNPAGNIGQGIALAARAGAVLSDMEFVQFHPTALASARYPLALVSEAVRGEGATLVNSRGIRFLAETPGAELAPRDVVARAIAREIRGGEQVFLDARVLRGKAFAERFPIIERMCREAGIDPARQLIPVRPAAHYHMGGIAADAAGRTSVEGLWAVGEVACTGLHGANRLASNSLLEAAAMGMLAADDISHWQRPAGVAAPVFEHVDDPAPAGVFASIRATVSHDLGILRDASGLGNAIARLLALAQDHGADADAAAVALSVAVFAALREESRGGHARNDFPARAATATRRHLRFDQVLAHARELFPSPLSRSA